MLHQSASETNLQLRIDQEAAEKNKYQSLHSELFEQHRTLSEELQSTQRDLQMRIEVLQGKEQECTQLRSQMESLLLENQQMTGELNTTGKSLEKTLDRYVCVFVNLLKIYKFQNEVGIDKKH